MTACTIELSPTKELTSISSFQAWLTRLRETGELPPKEYGADIGPSEFLKIISLSQSPMLVLGVLKHLLTSKHL